GVVNQVETLGGYGTEAVRVLEGRVSGHNGIGDVQGRHADVEAAALTYRSLVAGDRTGGEGRGRENPHAAGGACRGRVVGQRRARHGQRAGINHDPAARGGTVPGDGTVDDGQALGEQI